MNVRRALVAVLAVSGLCLAAPSLVRSSPLVQQATSNEDASKAARKGVEQAYKDASKEAAKKNPETVYGHCAADYTFVTTTGTTQKLSERAELMKELLSVTESFKVESKIQQFTVNPDGTATAEINEKLTLVAKDPESGQKVTLNSDSKLVDTWVSSDGKWRLQQTKVISAKSRMNGKEIGS